jgi:nucleoside-diphosphate-sugar epimerase
MMKKTETNMKMHPGSQELRMFSLKAHYGIEKARDLLNFRPQYNVDRGLALSVRWLEHESMFSHQSPLG